MKDAADYLGHIKALIALNRQVVHWEVVREEAQGDVGLLRYRLTLRDGGLLEIFERFQVVEVRLQVTKYSFHWQDADGQSGFHPELTGRENIYLNGAIPSTGSGQAWG